MRTNDNTLLVLLAALWLLKQPTPPPGWHPPMALPKDE